MPETSQGNDYELISDKEATCSHFVGEYQVTNRKGQEDDADNQSTDFKTRLLSSDKRTEGLNVFTAAVFLAGELAGTGVLTMPSALSRTGYYGIGLILVTVSLATYCGILLGKAWDAVKREREKEEHISDPYPYIGEAAFGKHGRNIVTVLLTVNIVLICLVYLTLTTEIISSLLTFHIKSIPHKEEFRLWLVICTVAILPFTWFGTPKDFWGIGLAALSTTAIGAILILVKLGIMAPTTRKNTFHEDVGIISFFSGFGTFIFAFTGISLYPTVQTDMKDQTKFTPAVILGAFMVLVIYFPVAIYGNFVLGRDAKSSVLENLSEFDEHRHTKRVLVSLADLLFVAHLLFAFVMYVNPLVQQLEGFLKVKNEFSWRRCLLRSMVVFGILALGEIFPKFGPIIDLVGGFLKTILCFIFPIVFYIRLHRPLALWHRILLAILILVSIIGCVFSTYAAIQNIRSAFKDIYFT